MAFRTPAHLQAKAEPAAPAERTAGNPTRGEPWSLLPVPGDRSSSTVEGHAGILRRISGRSQSQDAPFLTGLQQLYGNRYVQRVLDATSKPEAAGELEPDVEAAILRERGRGDTLGEGVRARMEGAFGTDFSSVRVHTDSKAHQLNRAVSAVAFTTADDIFFSRGAYQPDTSEGKKLLAHELTHVVQQGGQASPGKLVLSDPHDRSEQEAAGVSQQITAAPVGAVARCACGGQSAGGEECEACRMDGHEAEERAGVGQRKLR
jgi:Domain of unknown function (DUF4157)